MSDAMQLPVSGQSDETRRFFEQYKALREDGKTNREILDELGDDFESVIRRAFQAHKPEDTINVINPEGYETLVRAAKTLVLMGFEGDEVEMKINGRHCIGHVVLRSDDVVFDRDCLAMLSDILDTVGSVSMEATHDGKVRMCFTIPQVLKKL